MDTPQTPPRISLPPSQGAPHLSSSSSNWESGSLPGGSKLVLEDQLHHVTFEAPPPFGTNTVDLKQVLAKLHQGPLARWADALCNAGRIAPHPTDPSWPKLEKEGAYHEPFRDLLNAINFEGRRHIPVGCHKRLTFSVYDREMADIIVGAAPLKPDVLAAEQRVPWGDEEGAVEVKSEWRDIMRQAASYGRALLASRRSRRLAWVICLNHRTSEARVVFHHREGVTATEAFNLSTHSGFFDFVEAVLDIVLAPDAFSAGMDPSRSGTKVVLPTPDSAFIFTFTHELCNRICVRGRATNVLRVERLPDSSSKVDKMWPPGSIPAPVPRRLVTTTEGRPLRDAGGPRPLLEAIIHGLIGYLNLFKAGWQHRDVSNSNLLLVRNFQVTNAPLHDEARRFQLEFCTGVITDGDQAVLWKESREVATHRSGTLPFISLALLDNKNRPHSALDDFESFVWVLLWEMMHKGQQLGLLETDDQTCLKELCVTSPDILLWSKAACRSRFLLETEIDSFVPVAALVKMWFKLALKSEKRLSTLLGGAKGDTTAFADHVEEIERLCLDTGRKYVETGLAYLPLLDESWSVKEPSL